MNQYVRDNTPIFYTKTTTKTVVNTTTETDLFNGEFLIGANEMGVKQRLQGWASGNALNNTGGSVTIPRFKLKLGSTVVFDTSNDAGSTMQNSATRLPWMICFEIQQLDASNQQLVTMRGHTADDDNGITFAVGSGFYRRTATAPGRLLFGVATTSVDMTSSQLLAFTVINGTANANVETVLLGAKIAIGT
jgi:hypothetical protein